MTTDRDGLDYFAPAPPMGRRPVPPAPATPVRGTGPLRAGTPSHLQPKTSRWAKSDVTFGPVGRIVTTLVLVLPFLFFVAAGLFTMDPIVLAGAAIWAALMITGMRHVWQPVQRR
jgi:hypothetical protein